MPGLNWKSLRVGSSLVVAYTDKKPDYPLCSCSRLQTESVTFSRSAARVDQVIPQSPTFDLANICLHLELLVFLKIC